MANKQKMKARREIRRRRHVRSQIRGSAERPRLTVSKSLRNTVAQLVDDDRGVTLVYAITNPAEKKSKTDAAKEVGKQAAAKALELGITNAVFDRNLYIYHGRVKAVAEGAREAGLKI